MFTHVAVIFEIQLRGCEGPTVFQVRNPMLGGGRVPVGKNSIPQPLTLPITSSPLNITHMYKIKPQKNTHTSPKVLDMLNSVS